MNAQHEPTIPATDEAWDDRILGADESYTALAEDNEAEFSAASGTRLISIRMSESMIDDLKLIAQKNKNIGYQTLIKQVLQRFIDCEKKMIWNEMVQEFMNQEAKKAGEKPEKRKRA